MYYVYSIALIMVRGTVRTGINGIIRLACVYGDVSHVKTIRLRCTSED